MPIIMFCGLPVMVATLPMFDAMATASRYGTGLRPSRRVISSTSGVSTRHMVSLTKNAEKTPATSTMPESSTQRAVRVIHHPGADQGEEAGEPQVGHHDHHAEEQDDGVVVDGRVGLLHGENVEGQHQARADDRRAGAVQPQAGQASDGQHQVGAGKDEDGGEQIS